MDSTELNKATFHRFVDEIPNKRNFAALDEFLSQDAVWRLPSAPAVEGRDAVKAMIEQNLAGFSDVQVQIKELVAEGDLLAARVTATGTSSDALLGPDAAGRQVSFAINHLFRFRDGKIVEDRPVSDELGLLTQLGFQPARPE